MSSYQNEWKTYRSIRKRLFLIWLLFFPVCLVVAVLAPMKLGVVSGRSYLAAGIVSALWVWLFARAARRLHDWPCPQCGQPFHGWWKGSSRKCVHCGLGRYALEPERK